MCREFFQEKTTDPMMRHWCLDVSSCSLVSGMDQSGGIGKLQRSIAKFQNADLQERMELVICAEEQLSCLLNAAEIDWGCNLQVSVHLFWMASSSSWKRPRNAGKLMNCHEGDKSGEESQLQGVSENYWSWLSATWTWQTLPPTRQWRQRSHISQSCWRIFNPKLWEGGRSKSWQEIDAWCFRTMEPVAKFAHRPAYGTNLFAGWCWLASASL